MAGNDPGDPGLAGKAFGFLRIAPRPSKPRTTGLTVLSDKGMGSHAVEDLLETGADYLDWVKLSMGSARILSEDTLKRKISAYHGADVKVLLTGDAFELGVNQGVMGRVYDTAAALGFDGVEVATAQISLSLEGKAVLVARAKRSGLEVVAEIGQKGLAGQPANGTWLAHEGAALREAGADLILLQGEGITEDVAEIHEDVLFTVAAALGTKQVVYQAKDERTHAWYINHLGPDTNLDIDIGQLLSVELGRRGARKRGLFGVVAAPHPEDMDID